MTAAKGPPLQQRATMKIIAPRLSVGRTPLMKVSLMNRLCHGFNLSFIHFNSSTGCHPYLPSSINLSFSPTFIIQKQQQCGQHRRRLHQQCIRYRNNNLDMRYLQQSTSIIISILHSSSCTGISLPTEFDCCAHGEFSNDSATFASFSSAGGIYHRSFILSILY